MRLSHVHVRAWALGYFYSHISTDPNLSEGADRVGGQLRGDKEYPFRHRVTKSGTESLGKGPCRKAMIGVW